MTGVVGFIIGAAEGSPDDTETFSEELGVSLVGAFAEPIAALLFAMVAWFFGIFGIANLAPAIAGIEWTLTPVAILTTIVGLMVSGFIGAFFGIQARQVAHWFREAFFGDRY
jgi:ABC-type long-subunit fatty acid transport system fused permease/ATPase subunit